MTIFCLDCGEPIYPVKRRDLGYHTCIDCGSPAFKPPIIPMNKSNYVVGTLQDLKESYGHKGTRI